MMKSKDCCVKKNKTHNLTVIKRKQKPEAYSELSQTSNIECFTKKVNAF